jgi:hypothetical protein
VSWDERQACKHDRESRREEPCERLHEQRIHFAERCIRCLGHPGPEAGCDAAEPVLREPLPDLACRLEHSRARPKQSHVSRDRIRGPREDVSCTAVAGIGGAMEEVRFLAHIPDEGPPNDHDAPQRPRPFPKRDFRARLELVEALVGYGERERNREERAAREPLAIEDAPVVAVAHEAAQWARASGSEELEIEKLLGIEREAGQRARARLQLLGFSFIEDAVDEDASMRLHER